MILSKICLLWIRERRHLPQSRARERNQQMMMKLLQSLLEEVEDETKCMFATCLLTINCIESSCLY